MKAKTKKIVFATAVTVLCAVALYFIFIISFWLFASEKIYPGVKVAGVNISGKTEKEATEILQEKFNEYQKEKINFSGEKSNLVAVADLEPKCNFNLTAKKAIEIGKKNLFFLGKHANLDLICSANYNKVLDRVKFNETGVENSKIEKREEEIVCLEGKSGKRLNYAEFAARVNKALGNFELKVDLPEFTIEPTFSQKDFEAKKTEIIKQTENSLILAFEDNKKFVVDAKTLLGWVGFESKELVFAFRFSQDELFRPLAVGLSGNGLFSYDAVSSYLKVLAEKINTKPQNAKLSSTDGKVIVVANDIDGKSLNIEESASAIVSYLDDSFKKESSKKEGEVALIVENVKAEIRKDNLSELGINELISTGFSTFTGSPKNRQHNIRTGASKFNGVLIGPDEKFSFIKILGPVDESTGYLPELVIKENKTIPEYGGGMCQVSSTAFRAALNAGLPIFERTPHSYPVSYYKPFGVDATVYIPKPDLVFKNDTGKYILVQTKIEGTKLTFEFYGTKKPVKVKFSGNEKGEGAVEVVEKVTPAIYDQGVRGNGSFTAIVYRHIYDLDGKLIDNNKFVSKYDSPDKYPH